MFHTPSSRTTRGNMVSVLGCEGAGGAGGASGEESFVISKMSKPPTRDNGSEASSLAVVVRQRVLYSSKAQITWAAGRSLARSRCQSESPLSHAPCSLLQSCVIAPSSSFKVSSTLIFASCEAHAHAAPPHVQSESKRSNHFLVPWNVLFLPSPSINLSPAMMFVCSICGPE